jgi:hypothetical protein
VRIFRRESCVIKVVLRFARLATATNKPKTKPSTLGQRYALRGVAGEIVDRFHSSRVGGKYGVICIKLSRPPDSSYCKIPCMVKKEEVPEYLPISPTTLPCPTCQAKPGEACGTSSGVHLEFVHLARIMVVAKLDQANSARPN